MIVEVKFFREKSQAYVGRGYSYDTEMPLKVGDRVIAPAAGGKNRAIVTAVDVPAENINPGYFPLKQIAEYDTPEVTV